VGPFLTGTIGTLEGDDHFQRRRVESALFRPRVLGRHDEMAAGTLREQLRSAPSRPVRADVVRLVRNALLPVAVGLVGLDGVDTPQRLERLEALTELLNKGTSSAAATDPAAAVAEALPAKQAFLDEFVAPSLARRRDLLESGRTEELPLDLLAVLLEAHGPEGVLPWIQNEAVGFLSGATANLTVVATRTLDELFGWLPSHPEHMDAVADQEFLRRALSETARLHPVSPALFRRSLVDTELSGGRRIAAGELLYLELASANLDPDVFGAGAGEFDPFRPLPERVRGFALGFGSGRHLCIGLQLSVGGPYRTSAGEEVLGGLLPALLGELFAAGIELDPDDPPQRDPATFKPMYRSFPAVFRSVPS
jgi:cytochrome P450